MAHQHESDIQQAAPAAASAILVNGQTASHQPDALITDGLPIAAMNHAAVLLQRNMQSLSLDVTVDLAVAREFKAPPKSVLEHFEEAVDKEAQGSLGQSLELYRKAYRLDNDYDKLYRNKHFSRVNGSSYVSQRNITACNIQSDKQTTSRLSTTELILSFAQVPILPEEPLTEGTPPSPCPLSYAPSELVAEVSCCLACQDPSYLTRVALTPVE
ncbi:hypothetical protein KEM54_002129 [Ascosphaera aggregata]|nr:hypothetical protein KEM54_002129 [Ascosphaera aggregata]